MQRHIVTFWHCNVEVLNDGRCQQEQCIPSESLASTQPLASRKWQWFVQPRWEQAVFVQKPFWLEDIGLIENRFVHVTAFYRAEDNCSLEYFVVISEKPRPNSKIEHSTAYPEDITNYKLPLVSCNHGIPCLLTLDAEDHQVLMIGDA